MLKEEVYKEKEIEKLFTSKNIDFSIFSAFFKENRWIFMDNFSKDQIYFIYNHLEFYGLLFVKQDHYYWSIYHKGNLLPLQTVDQNGKGNFDYVVELFIDFIESEKFYKLAPNYKNRSLEEKAKQMKKLKFNPFGYHLQ